MSGESSTTCEHKTRVLHHLFPAVLVNNIHVMVLKPVVIFLFAGDVKIHVGLGISLEWHLLVEKKIYEIIKYRYTNVVSGVCVAVGQE